MATAPKPIKASPAHRQAAKTFLDGLEGPFRRQQLAEVLYTRISPRSRQVADKLAQSLMTEMAKNGDIARHGHLHWVRVSKRRVLRSGRPVPELSEEATLKLGTRCPEKWAAVDMETGEVWVGSRAGWSRATAAQVDEMRSCLPQAKAKAR